MLKRLALLVSTVAIAMIVASPGVAQAQVHPAEAEAAIRYHFDWDEEDFAVAVSDCETGLGADIYNDYSGAHGILQIMPSTAYEMGYDYSALSDPWYAAWAAKDLHDYTESLGMWGFQPWACAY
jgi:hypothetical protein